MPKGYTFLYGLINFAILATALFFILRKLVPKMFGGRRTQIEDALRGSEEASVNAKALLTGIDGTNASAAAERAEILKEAQKTAEEKREQAEDILERTVRELKADNEKSLLYQKQTARIALTREAMDEVVAQAGTLLAEEKNAEAREKLSERLIHRAEEKLHITRGDLMAFQEKGFIPVEMRGVKPASEEHQKRLKAAILRALSDAGETATEDQIAITAVADESLIGGVYLRIGDTVYDSTLKGMLQRARESVSVLEHDDEELVDVLKDVLKEADRDPAVYQKGTVISVSDGICRISGVSDAMAGELIEFNQDLRGMVMDLEKDNIGVVLLGD